MAQHDTDPNLARLLAGRDEPSVLEKEAQFERVYQAVQGHDDRPARRLWSTRWTWLVPAVASLGLAMLLFPRKDADEFTARGAPSTAIVQGYCTRADALDPGAADLGPSRPGRTVCETGERLLLDLLPPHNRPYAAAYLERADGRILWLFPGRGQRLVKRPPAQTLYPDSFDLATLPPGEHRLHVVFSGEALTRDALSQLLERDSLDAERKLMVVTQPLQRRRPAPGGAP